MEYIYFYLKNTYTPTTYLHTPGGKFGLLMFFWRRSTFHTSVTVADSVDATPDVTEQDLQCRRDGDFAANGWSVHDRYRSTNTRTHGYTSHSRTKLYAQKDININITVFENGTDSDARKTLCRKTAVGAHETRKETRHGSR